MRACLTACILTAAVAAHGGQDAVTRAPVTVSAATVSIDGTSHRDPFLASTRSVRIVRLELTEPLAADALEQIIRPGGLASLEATIPVMTLRSPDKGVDARLHRSLKADMHPDIRFQLRSIQLLPDDPMGFPQVSAAGTLTIAGVERAVALETRIVRAGRTMLLEGRMDLLMTDYGIEPPKGVLGLIGTEPLVHVRVYLTVVMP